jgi:asparagine synthase (glutamine-hydrolysing)
MCGIVGLLDRRAETPEATLRANVAAMADTLAHRGPDGSGIWVDAQAGVALGHRRLAIIDLSPSGQQPMISADDRYVISYNGEVFNFRELRAELEAAGRHFRGSSDTEVIVEACAAWGLATTVQKLIGMFAFALWDRRDRSLSLVRDRLGIKPLYYRADGRSLMFGSELKALRACPGWRPELDRDALAAYLRAAYVPAPQTIYRGVRKLMPGTILTLGHAGEPEINSFWDLRQVSIAGLEAARGDRRDPAEAVAELDALLRDAVRRRMIADVPLGAFLSGGIDSSTVVALMQAECNRPVKTFTIGFKERGYDEARHAGRVAAHLGTEHTELYVEPEHALEIIPRLPDLYDEPFADPSQIPTYLVSEMTRKHVSVALSGDGGDELFAGYTRYYVALALMRRIERLPWWFRRAAARALRTAPAAAARAAAALIPKAWRPLRPAEGLRKLADLLMERGPDAVYRRLVSQWDEPGRVAASGGETHWPPEDPALAAEIPEPLARLQYFDTKTYLPDDILTKVDRASMAVSLEARVPLLDHRVVEFAWRLPVSLRMRDGIGKWALRQVLKRYVPTQLIDRPKMGFGVPINAWLRGPLREWAEELFDSRALAADGVLKPEPIRALWREHLTGRRNEPYKLWTVLMFQAWRQRWRV